MGFWSPETINGILLMFSVILGVLLFSTAIVLLWYRLSDQQVDEITADLKQIRHDA